MRSAFRFTDRDSLREWLETRTFLLSVQRRRLIYLVLTTLTALLLFERWLPGISAGITVSLFMVVYVVYLTAVGAVKRRQARKAGGLYPPIPAVWPSVCVIVPAHNEIGVIEETVAHLLSLDYPNYTLLVVDDRSTDGTAQVLARLYQNQEDTTTSSGNACGPLPPAEDQPTRPRLQVLHRAADAQPGKSAVLNDALAATEAELLCVFDADARVEPDFLRALVPYVLLDGVAAAQARKVIDNSTDNWLTCCQHLEYAFDAYLQHNRDAGHGAVELRGNGQLLRRTALLALGGWDETTVTDDLELSTRLHLAGHDIRFAETVTVREEGITDFWRLLRQRCRWAEGSLRRYLEHGGAILFSKSMALRTRVDMLAYFVDFLFPLLVLADNVLVMATYMLGQGSRLHALMSFSLVPFFAIFFIPAIYIAIRRFTAYPWQDSVRLAVQTGGYMVAVWLPVVMYTFLKVLLAPRGDFYWSKTEHGQRFSPGLPAASWHSRTGAGEASAAAVQHANPPLPSARSNPPSLV